MNVEGDLCILGSGIAGMLLAERALGHGRQVLMIERGTRLTFEERKQRNYGIRALNSSGLIAMNNAIISPTTNPTTVPAATPRQSTFCSLGVISTSQSHGKPYHR